MTDKEKIKAIIKQYADKGERLLKDAYKNDECASTTGYWDGYSDCANGLLRELEDIQEEPKKCMYSKDNYTDEDRKVLCEGCEEECEFNKKEEPVSEDLEDVIGEYCSNPDNFATWIGGDETDDIRLIIKAIKFGANWQKQKDEAYTKSMYKIGINNGKVLMKQQIMAKAVDVEVKVDAGGYPYIPQIELYDYVKDIPLAREGEKYKVILIKED